MTDWIAPDDPALLASVRLAEGLRLRAYADPESPLGKQRALPLSHRRPGWQSLSGAPWTCGYGHTGPDVGPKTTCTEPQAETWLRADVADAMTILDAEDPWWRTMTPDRQRVLAEMCFNLGYGRLCGFHRMMAALQAGKWETAAAEMLNSVWALQVGERAQRLSKEMAAA